MEQEIPIMVKIVFIGRSGVGKTSLILRETEDIFGKIPNTIGIDFKIKMYKMGNRYVKAQLWDTCGAEQYKRIKTIYYNKSHAICICFDLSNKESLINLQRQLNFLQEICFKGRIYFIGCKSDLNHEVSKDEILQFVQKNNRKYYQTSSRDNIGVNTAFQEIVLGTAENQLIKYSEKKDKESNQITNLKNNQNKNAHSICSC